jgi:hypothetical protein
MWTHCNEPSIYSKPCLDQKVLPNNFPTLESPWLQTVLARPGRAKRLKIFLLHAMSKRKAHPESMSATKKVKVQHGSLDNLPWKSVARPIETGLDGDDGILELEEVDNVELVYEEKDGGKVVKFNVRSPSVQLLQLRLICPNLRQVLQLPAVGKPSAAGVESPASLTEHSQPPATVSFDGIMLFSGCVISYDAHSPGEQLRSCLSGARSTCILTCCRCYTKSRSPPLLQFSHEHCRWHFPVGTSLAWQRRYSSRTHPSPPILIHILVGIREDPRVRTTPSSPHTLTAEASYPKTQPPSPDSRSYPRTRLASFRPSQCIFQNH